MPNFDGKTAKRKLDGLIVLVREAGPSYELRVEATDRAGSDKLGSISKRFFLDHYEILSNEEQEADSNAVTQRWLKRRRAERGE